MKGQENMIHEIPEKFKLFGQDWTIRMGTELEMADDLGLCIVDNNLILLNDKQTEQSMTLTLLHELIHAVEQKLHLNLTEQQVDLIALGLLDMMTTTPTMTRIFKGEHNVKRK